VHTLEIVLALVALAVIVATVARRLGAPAPSLLVIAGVLVGLIPGVTSVQIPPDVVGLLVLPPLIYAAAIDVDVSELLRVLRPVLVLAVGLVAVTAIAVAATVHWIDPWVSLSVAFVLGAVLASTDPVAVSALARRLHLPPRLLALVQGESLLNDATSLVLFQVAVVVAVAGAPVGAFDVAGQFVLLGAGGVLVGLLSAWVVERLRRQTRDPVLATVLALLIPYVVFAVASSLHTSGVTAVVVCGLRLSHSGDRGSPAPLRLQIAHVYAVVVFLLESVVFAVIGLELPALVSRLSADDRDFLPLALAVTVVVVLTRALWVYPSGALTGLRERRREQTPTPWRALAVIPLTTSTGAPFPERDLLLVVATTCIILTLIVQGLTLEPLVRRLRVGQDPAARERELVDGRHAAALAALDRLDEIDDAGRESPAVIARLRHDVEARAASARAQLTAMDAAAATGEPAPPRTGSPELTYRRLSGELLAAERDRLDQLRDEGRIGEDTRRTLHHAIDLEEARLNRA